MMKETVKIGGIYKHYKGNLYKIITIGKHSETGEDMIVYQSLINNDVWIRPAAMWNNIIDDNGTKRFTLQNDV